MLKMLPANILSEIVQQQSSHIRDLFYSPKTRWERVEISWLEVVVMKSSLTLVIEQLVVDGKVVLHVMELSIALLLDVHLGHPVV